MQEILSIAIPMKHTKKSFMLWGYISFKEVKEMTFITSTIYAHEFIEILKNFHIPLMKNWFGDDEVSFQYNNESFQKRLTFFS